MTQNKKIPASVGILTLNNAKQLLKIAHNLEAFDDVYICDGNSTDGTQELARSLGLRATKQVDTDEPNQRITDFGAARTHCLDQAKYDWHVRVDSDEELSPEVIEEIAKIVANPNPPHLVYKMPRKYIWQGKVIDDTITYPNLQIRFFNRKVAPRYEKITHEKLFIIPGTKVGLLKNPMYAPMPDTGSFFGGQRTLERALVWDRLQYEKHMTLKTWLKATIHTAALLGLYTLREFRVRFITRGNTFPLPYELWRFKYQILTWWLATKITFQKIFS
jgi:glycosyltransferase involved in cell wall biosynthesis